MRWKKTKLSLILIILTVCTLFVQTPLMNLKNNALVKNLPTDLHNSGVTQVTNTKQWILNGDFSTSDNWTSEKSILGDPDDVDATISSGAANFIINGELDKYSIAGTPNSSWTAFDNIDWGVGMDDGTERGIDSYGCWVDYTWDESVDQTGGTPSVHWKRNITLPVDMSDYKITSATLNVIFNATVTATGTGGIDVFDDQTQLQVGDYARFYVLISDIENVYQPFQIANNRTKYLGWDTGPVTTIEDTSLTNIDEALLINYLGLILGANSTVFTMTLGIDLFCEDNIGGNDQDSWDKLRINFINLTFTYERKIDQQTFISWNQKGDKPSDIITNPFVINEAILNFTYKVNDPLPQALSSNSEFQILINGFPHSETIKLWTAETTPQNASSNGFDVTRLIDKNKNINVSIRVYLADQFELNRTIIFSIDNIFLNITYTEDIADIDTDLKLFLNGEEKTLSPYIEIPLAENLNITVKYTNLTGEYIPGALVELEGKANGTLDPYPILEQYTIIINTTQLGIGVKILTVTAEKNFYTSQSINFFVDVVERETELLLYLNDTPKLSGETIQLELNETLEVKVEFRDNITTNLLKNATIELVGMGELNETNGIYNIFLNASDLGQGTTPFSIFAQKVNYVTKSIKFYVEVFEGKTELLLYLDDVQKFDKDTIQGKIDESINVTVYYQEDFSKQHLPGATVNLVGVGKFNETNNYYNYTIDANDLGEGYTVFTIFAQLDNYQSQSIQFIVELIDIETNISLFVDGTHTNDGDTILVEVDDVINITVYYRDNETKLHLPGAIVELVGRGYLNETNDYYNISINAASLDQGITILKIFAQLVNYRAQSIQIFVKIVERSTNIQLILNNEDKTLDPTFSLTIGQPLNITVKFTDNQTGDHINTALIQIIGQGFTYNLTRDDILGQYNITLDTEDLGIGVKLFSIVAQANNFQIKSIDPRITVSRISAEIRTSSGESQIEAEIGDDILLEIILNDTIFGADITGALVTFNWAYGQGELEDPNNDGTYEYLLENVREGVHTITISAFAGDDYDFEGYEITLVVTAPTVNPSPDLSWLVYVLVGTIAGLTVIFTLYQTHFKYPPMVRKIRSLKKKFRKNRRVKKPLIVQKREKIVETSYKTPINKLEIKTIVKMSEPVQQESPKSLLEEIPEPKKESTFDKINKLDKEEGGE